LCHHLEAHSAYSQGLGVRARRTYQAKRKMIFITSKANSKTPPKQSISFLGIKRSSISSRTKKKKEASFRKHLGQGSQFQSLSIDDYSLQEPFNIGFDALDSAMTSAMHMKSAKNLQINTKFIDQIQTQDSALKG